jgi:Domain of unknown function (DUF4386)
MTSDVQPAAPHVDTSGLSTTDDTTVANTPDRSVFSSGSEPDADRVLVDRSAAVRQARIAGLLYLVMAVFGGFAQIVRLRVYVPGDAATTAANLVSNATLVRLSFVADLLQTLVWLCLAMVLYRMFQHAGKAIARAMVIFVVVSVGIASLNMVNQLGALLVATTPAYATALGNDGSDALALLLMDLHHYGYLIAQLSWVWLFALGLLGYRSGLFPRPLAIVLMLSTVCYMVDALVRFLAPDLADQSAAVFVVPETVSEVALLLYLLIRGVKTTPPARQTL